MQKSGQYFNHHQIELMKIRFCFRSDVNFQDNLLNILRDSLTNTNPQVRLYTLQLFNVNDNFHSESMNFLYWNLDYSNTCRTFDYIL